MQPVGFIGLGNMGRGMCDNLIKKGYPVTAYDINPAAMDFFRDRAVLANNSLDVFIASDVTFLSLPSSEVIESVVAAFLKHGVKGKTIVDTSTSYPESTKQLYAEFLAGGGHFIDAPLLGGPANTAAGNAPCMISGDQDAVDSVRSIVASYAEPINYFGPAGTAHTVKLAMNFSGLMYAALLAQMFPLMEKMGIDTQHLYQVMNDKSFGNGVFKFYAPKFVNKDYHLDFKLELALKDMQYVRRLYDQYNCPAFLLDGGLNLMREAVKEGRGTHDMSEIAAVVYEYLGLDTGETKQ
ncbi:MAG: NAD(P)-dependent oxidoreductase [Ruminococcaceae bacterium]|nr:NAD(P)-dependent oxidoreductase [Oscillospiraceae bacterium]